MSAKSATADTATHRAAMIARAERRRAMLEELAEVGATLAKEIAVRMIDGPYHPEPRHDPGRSYAAVSRAVRLTFALEAKVDQQILSLCNGDFDLNNAPKARTASEPQRPVAHALSARDEIGEAASTLEGDRECLVESDRPDLPDIDAHLGSPSAPPYPEVWRADSRRPAASRVGVGRDVGSLGQAGDDNNREHFAVPPSRSRPDGGSRPPHFGRGRDLEAPAGADAAFERGADPPYRE